MSLKDKKIGFIGLGTMGLPMAQNILKAGYDLGVYNRTESRAEIFRDKGATVYYAPWELAESSDVIIIMVSAPDDLLEIIESIKDVISSGKIVINMSTVSYEATREAAALVKTKSCRFLDAPVSGSKQPAEQASLVILAGGEENLLDECGPLLMTMGTKAIHCGDIGSGTMMKLMINMLLGSMMASFCEALVFGKKVGLKPEDMLTTIEAGALNCPMFKLKGQNILRQDFAKAFPIDLLFKDLNLALEAGGKIGLPLMQTAAAREAFCGAIGLELGDLDMSALIKYFEKNADIEITR